MAAVTRQLGTADGGLVSISYTFDDVSGLISTIIEVNSGSPGTLTYTLSDPITHANAFGTPRTIAVGSGTKNVNVAGLNQHMLFQEGTGRGAGTFGWVFPWDTTLAFKNG